MSAAGRPGEPGASPRSSVSCVDQRTLVVPMPVRTASSLALARRPSAEQHGRRVPALAAGGDRDEHRAIPREGLRRAADGEADGRGGCPLSFPNASRGKAATAAADTDGGPGVAAPM